MGTMGHYHDVLDEIGEPFRELRGLVPEVTTSYAALHRAALADGVLPARMKELLALAIAITRECDGCIASHARGAARRGATAAEVAEAIGVAVLMNGGPATVYGPRALQAFHEFAGDSPASGGSAAGAAPSAPAGAPAAGAAPATGAPATRSTPASPSA